MDVYVYMCTACIKVLKKRKSGAERRTCFVECERSVLSATFALQNGRDEAHAADEGAQQPAEL